MFPTLTAYHIPSLFVGTFTAFGGLWPLIETPSSMIAFGFTPQISNVRATHPVMVTSGARTTAIGALLFTFFSQGKLAEVDTVMTWYGAYVGTVDAYALWGVNDSKALFRLVTGLMIGAWGCYGMSSR